MNIIVDGCLAYIDGVEYSAKQLDELTDELLDAMNTINENYSELYYIMHPRKVLAPGECPF